MQKYNMNQANKQIIVSIESVLSDSGKRLGIGVIGKLTAITQMQLRLESGKMLSLRLFKFSSAGEFSFPVVIHLDL